MKTKITAEEKHYQKLNNKLRKELNGFVDAQHRLLEEKHKLNTENQLLKDQLKLVTEENEFLKSKVVNLSDEEVKRLVQSSKRLEDLTSMTSILFGNSFGRGLF